MTDTKPIDVRHYRNIANHGRGSSMTAALHEALDAYETLVKALEGENVCDACAGTGKPVSGLPCMCGGTGKMSDAVRNLRDLVYTLQRDLEAARREPVSPDDERANPVWDLVIAACQQAWPERRDYCQSPTELIVQLINERDEARRELQRVGEMHVISIKRALRAERREDDLIEAIRAALARLHKNRPFWNGPQHECAAVLGKALRCDEEPQPTPQAGEE